MLSGGPHAYNWTTGASLEHATKELRQASTSQLKISKSKVLQATSDARYERASGDVPMYTDTQQRRCVAGIDVFIIQSFSTPSSRHHRVNGTPPMRCVNADQASEGPGEPDASFHGEIARN